MTEMAKQSLPYWIFFLCGGFITGYSLFVSKTASNANPAVMKLFIYIGLVFLGIGLIKLMFELITKKRAAKITNKLAGIDEIDADEKIIKQENQQRLNNLNSINTLKNQNKMPYMNNNFSYCQQCGSKNFIQSSFCTRCGTRLR